MDPVRRLVVRRGAAFPVWDHGPQDQHGWDFWSAFSSTASAPVGSRTPAAQPPSWEPYLDGVLDEVCTPRSVFVDIGAWIGPVSLLASRRCAAVYAFEPDPFAWRQLIANVSRQQVGCEIHTYAAAVVGDPQQTVAHIGRRHDRAFGDSMTSTIFEVDKIAVPACTISDIAAWCRLDRFDPIIFKIDVEGGEEEILSAGARTIRLLGAPLLLSLHPILVDDPGRYTRTVGAALDGFDVRHVGGVPGGLETVLAVPR